MIKEEEEEQQQNMAEELTGDTLTEFLQLLNEEDYSNAILDKKLTYLSFEKGRHGCRYENLAQLSIETGDTECIISNTEISTPQDSSASEINNDGSTETLFETVQKSDIVSVLLTKTNR